MFDTRIEAVSRRDLAPQFILGLFDGAMSVLGVVYYALIPICNLTLARSFSAEKQLSASRRTSVGIQRILVGAERAKKPVSSCVTRSGSS
jgi:hypothetical protein